MDVIVTDSGYQGKLINVHTLQANTVCTFNKYAQRLPRGKGIAEKTLLKKGFSGLVKNREGFIAAKCCL